MVQGAGFVTEAVAGEASRLCAACPIAVRRALTRVPGVTEAKVDFDTKSAVVTFDPVKTNVEALTKATADVGFPSRLKP